MNTQSTDSARTSRCKSWLVATFRYKKTRVNGFQMTSARHILADASDTMILRIDYQKLLSLGGSALALFLLDLLLVEFQLLTLQNIPARNPELCMRHTFQVIL
jgi:hypothetical protein